MFTHATISMSHTIINNHCSTYRLNTLLTQCKLTTQVSRQLRLPRSDLALISDFYSAVNLKSRMQAVKAIIENDSFFRRQADVMCRYTDSNHWLNPDFDRLIAGYYTSYRTAEKIGREIDTSEFPKNWGIKKLGKPKFYSYGWKIATPSGTSFRLSFCNSKNQVNMRHLKLDLSPSYFSVDELKFFFTWLNSQMGSERDQAIEQSLISSMEIGLQLHQIFSPLLALRTFHGIRKDFMWQIRGAKQDFCQATYDEFEIDEIGQFTNKAYCPVSKLFNLIFKDRKYTEIDGRTLMSTISHAARLESVYSYSLASKNKEFSLNELEMVPSYISEFDLISLDEIAELTKLQKGRLITERKILQTLVKSTSSLTLPYESIQRKKMKMLKTFKAMLLN